MPRARAALAACLALALLAPAAAARRPLDAVTDGGQVSIPYDAALGPGTDMSLPLDEPPLARTVSAFEPEGIHLTPYGPGAILFSWQTGPATAPPVPFSADAVPAAVRVGRAPGALGPPLGAGAGAAAARSLRYEYLYDAAAGGGQYASPIIHHVLLDGLAPGRLYYRVGSDWGWSAELAFRVPDPAATSLRLAFFGDLGDTANSSATLAGLLRHGADAAVCLGDLVYADEHPSNATVDQNEIIKVIYPKMTPFTSQQARWDGWARLVQPLFATTPTLALGGDHELEPVPNVSGVAMVAFNARYPQPQDPASINTAPNNPATYLNASNANQFALDEGAVTPNNSFWSVALPPVHIISFNPYLPWGPGSKQRRWFDAAVAAVDRARTPWLLVATHVPAYHTYPKHFREGDPWLAAGWEAAFRAAGVDAVMAGHVHGYERSAPVFNYTLDACAPVYLTLGDGGNINDGLLKTFVDTPGAVPAFCADPAENALPWYAPTPTGGRPLFGVDAFNGSYCPQAQPETSRFRAPIFGSGVLDVRNATHALWRWISAEAGAPREVDRAWLSKTRGCDNQNRGVPAAALAALP